MSSSSRFARRSWRRARAAAATAFEQGNVARAAGRLDEAAAAYRKASELARSDHPQRRLCHLLRRSKQLEEAIAACERALALRSTSSLNKAALAAMLIERGGPADLRRALILADGAVALAPENPDVLQTWCYALIANDRPRLVDECIDRWLAIVPDDLTANYIAAIVAADEGHYDLARWRLEKSKVAGLSQTAYDDVTKRIDEVEEQNATFPKWAHTAGWIAVWIVLGWLGVMMLILGIGIVLSRKTLRTVNATMAKGGVDGEGSAQERRLRRIYKSVLLLSGVYFYLSIPILLGGTIAAGIGATVVIWSMGYVPVKLIAIIGFVVVVTVGAIVRSLVVRADTKPPGERIDLTLHPKLRAVLDEVAAAVATRPVDVAYLSRRVLTSPSPKQVGCGRRFAGGARSAASSSGSACSTA